MAKSCFQNQHLGRLAKSKQAALDIDHIPVLEIVWVERLAANTLPKIYSLGALYSVDYTSQVNIAHASIVSHSTRLHNHLNYLIIGRSNVITPGFI